MAAVPVPALLDLKAMASLTGRTRLRLAAESEFADFFPECEPGAMPPFGHLYGFDLFLDRALANADEIVFPGGRHEEEIRMSTRDYIELAQPTVVALSAARRAA